MDTSKSQIKRITKKIEKIKLKLAEKDGIIFSTEPTEIILIANGGLANDVKRHELELSLLAFKEYFKEVITPPQFTFAIVICNDRNSSEYILNNLLSFTIQTPDLKLRFSVIAFCMYVNYLPSTITPEIVKFNSSKPNGLIILNEFISSEEEKDIVKYFMDLNELFDSGNLKQRTVMHFGYEFNYENNLVDFSNPLENKPIPKCCSDLLLKLENYREKSYTSFNQLTVNIYHPGDGIPSHTDTHSVFTDEIISFSLNSDIIMEWNTPDTNHKHRNIDLKARSVCIMSGESRYLWKHGIASRKSDLIYFPETNQFEKRQRKLRISLTFRQIKSIPECDCKWPKNCDYKSNRNNNKEDFQPDKPDRLEEEFVHQVYDNIAQHFSSTRHSMWPRVREFIEKQSPGSIGADIGCGNGKYFPAITNRGFLLGTDSSFNLCKIASETHKIDTLQSNCLQLPYRSRCCDYFICIAVLHHLSTSERRKESVEKMANILCRKGKGLIYVWAKEQEKNGVKSKYLNKKSSDSKLSCDDIERNNQDVPLPVHLNRTQFSNTDMLVPWCNKSQQKSGETQQVFTRYYHLFQQNELENLCRTVEGIQIIDSWYDSGNWVVVIEKL